MSSTNINIRTEKEIKEEAEKVFEKLGLNMSTAINMFLRQVVMKEGIPFELMVSSKKEKEASEKPAKSMLDEIKEALEYEV